MSKKESKNKMSAGKKVLVAIAIVVGLFLGLAMCGSTVEDEPVAKAKQAEALTPLEQVEADVDIEGLKISKEGKDIVAVFPVSDNLSNEMIVDGARMDSRDIVGALEDNGVKYEELDISGTWDKDVVYYIYLTHEAVAGMDPDVTLAEDFAELALAEEIHPSLL